MSVPDIRVRNIRIRKLTCSEEQFPGIVVLYSFNHEDISFSIGVNDSGTPLYNGSHIHFVRE